MAAFSPAQAKQELDRLIDEAPTGEAATVAREERTVLIPTPASPGKTPIDAEYLKYIRDVRRRGLTSAATR